MHINQIPLLPQLQHNSFWFLNITLCIFCEGFFTTMSIITPYIKNLEKIKSDLEQVALEAVGENSDFILFLIKDRQLGLGMNTSGNVWKYNPNTEGFIDSSNPPRTGKSPGSPFTFEWTGAWLDGFFVKSEGQGYSILSRDGKTAFLESKYGRLVKLTEEHNKQVNEIVIKPALGNFILENLFKF